MKSLVVALYLSAFAGSALAQEAKTPFLWGDEAEIESVELGKLTVIAFEDFQQYSVQPGLILAIEGNSVLIKRNEQLALLVPKAQFAEVVAMGAAPFVTLVDGTCSSTCGGAAIGGALVGGLQGATSGAQAGGAIAGPHGAAGGLVIGGSVGAVGGAMAAYETCKWASGCMRTNDEPTPGNPREN